MSVLITTGIYPPDIGGPATFIPELAKELEFRGRRPVVITLKPKRFDGNFPSYPLILITRSPNRFYRFTKSITVVMIQAAKSKQIFSNGLYIESGLAALILRKQAVAKLVGDPIWEKCRNSGATKLSITEFQSFRMSFRYRVLKKLYVFALNQFTVIFCPSHELVAIFQNWGIRTPIKCIPNGVKIINNQPLEKKYDLICVSRLVKWKNVDQCIRVAGRLKLSLLVIGTGPEFNNLELLSRQVSADSTFLGDCSPSEVFAYLAKSKVYMLLSQYEGLSFSLLEAMAAELSVVVSNVPGNIAVVRNNENGIVVESTNLDVIAESVERLFYDERLRMKLGRAAKSFVQENYNLIDCLDDSISLLDS